jgi:tetratricopeptide (TPR) repeat protein
MSGVASADRTQEAKALYAEGKKAFQEQRYDVALRFFEHAYQSSSRPALLFDMATCLSALDRPREAAAKLRAFLDRVPNEPQRAEIEASIGELKARAAEQEAAVNAEREAARVDERQALEQRIRLLEERLSTPPPDHRRRNLAIGLGVTAGVVVIGTALALGLALNHGDSNTPSSFAGGPLQATR